MSRARPSGGPRSGLTALLHDFREFAGGRLWLALALMLSGAIAEGFGLLMIVPLASIAIGADQSLFLRYAGWAAALSPNQRFGASLALFVGAMAARSLLLFGRDLQTTRLQSEYEASLRLRSAATLARRGWGFASRIGQAGMQSLLLTDVPRVSNAVGFVQSFAVSATLLVVQLSITAFLSPVLTAVALLVLGLGAIASLGSMKQAVRRGQAISETAEESTSSGFRLHAGLKAALAQGTVGAFFAEYRASLSEATAQIVRSMRDFSATRQLAALASAAAAALLLFVGVRLLALPFPVLIASLVMFARMSAPAQALQQAAQQIAAYTPSFTAIEQRLGKLHSEPPRQAPNDRLEWNELRLEGVGFEHQSGMALREIQLSVNRGEWLAVAGASGSGKTTLIDLVAGLLPPEKGTVTLDGRLRVGEVLEHWRAGIAYIGQGGTVFNDSVLGNLLAEGAEADHVALWQALELVGLGERVRSLPGGLHQDVGDRGSHLSGGERQRLVIARALLRRPSLLILDEATSALDPAAEEQLMERLKALEPRPAALVVAHRDSTLAHCDSRVVIRNGRLIGPSGRAKAGPKPVSASSRPRP